MCTHDIYDDGLFREFTPPPSEEQSAGFVCTLHNRDETKLPICVVGMPKYIYTIRHPVFRSICNSYVDIMYALDTPQRLSFIAVINYQPNLYLTVCLYILKRSDVFPEIVINLRYSL